MSCALHLVLTVLVEQWINQLSWTGHDICVDLTAGSTDDGNRVSSPLPLYL